MESSISIVDELKVLERDNDIRFAYLFGSQANRIYNKSSDIDIGVYLVDELDSKQLFHKQISLISQLSSLFNTDELDIVILNNENIALHWNIVKHGILIFEKNKVERVDWEAQIVTRWLDWKPTLKLWREGFEYNMEKGLSWQ